MTKRVNRARRSFSLENGPYQVAPSLRDRVRELGQMPQRADVGERVQAGGVAVLRYHGSPKAMAARSGFFLPVREMAARLGITKAQMETVLRYLDGEMIERVAVPEGEFRKHKAEGTWHNDAVLWRFTAKWYHALLRLHHASKRLAAISDKFKSASMFVCTQVSHLPRRWLSLITRSFPDLHLSGIAVERLKQLTRNRPAAPPSKLVPSRWVRPQAAPESAEIVLRSAPGTVLQRPSMFARLADVIRGSLTHAAPPVIADVRAHSAFNSLPSYESPDDREAGDRDPRFTKALAKRCVAAQAIVGARMAADPPAAKRQMRKGERTFGENVQVTFPDKATIDG